MKNLIYLQCRRPKFDPWVGQVPWRRTWLTYRFSDRCSVPADFQIALKPGEKDIVPWIWSLARESGSHQATGGGGHHSVRPGLLQGPGEHGESKLLSAATEAPGLPLGSLGAGRNPKFPQREGPGASESRLW